MGDAGATPPSNGDNGKTEPTTVASLRSAQEAKQRIDESNPIDWTEYAGGDAGDQAARSTAVTTDVHAMARFLAHRRRPPLHGQSG